MIHSASGRMVTVALFTLWRQKMPDAISVVGPCVILTTIMLKSWRNHVWGFLFAVRIARRKPEVKSIYVQQFVTKLAGNKLVSYSHVNSQTSLNGKVVGWFTILLLSKLFAVIVWNFPVCVNQICKLPWNVTWYAFICFVLLFGFMIFCDHNFPTLHLVLRKQ